MKRKDAVALIDSDGIFERIHDDKQRSVAFVTSTDSKLFESRR